MFIIFVLDDWVGNFVVVDCVFDVGGVFFECEFG